MRKKSQDTLEKIMKFVNRYFQENHFSPTIDAVSEGVGVPRSTVHRYLVELSEKGELDYKRGILTAPESAKFKSSYISAPILGSICCGTPEEEEESVEEFVSLPVSIFGKGNFYILHARGNSMVDAGIDEDDIVVIERDCDVREGDIVVALADNENTLKRYMGFDKKSKSYLLKYENKAIYPDKVIKVKSFTVQGVARHVIKPL